MCNSEQFYYIVQSYEIYFLLSYSARHFITVATTSLKFITRACSNLFYFSRTALCFKELACYDHIVFLFTKLLFLQLYSIQSLTNRIITSDHHFQSEDDL